MLSPESTCAHVTSRRRFYPPFRDATCDRTANILLFIAGYSRLGAVVEHTFHVANHVVRRLCEDREITTVNGQLPGPTINVHEGDTVIVTAINDSPYNLTMHWHGIFQLQSPWADGADYVTQCPILPGNSYTYKFDIIGQRGTHWWHAHFSWLRATVHGALVIYPKRGQTYPYPKPYSETVIMLGEWYNANVVDVIDEALRTGVGPKKSDAFTINGKPGYYYPCSRKHPYQLHVKANRTYLLRIINAALNPHLFFQVANHSLTVVGIDASYTTPYRTGTIVLAPGQVTDVLLNTDQPPAHYAIAATSYISVPGGSTTFNNSTTSGALVYRGCGAPPEVPYPASLPQNEDTPTAHKFYSNLTALVSKDYPTNVPLDIDENLFVTTSLGLLECPLNQTCQGPLGKKIACSMNNVSYERPHSLSMLEAEFYGVEGLFTRDFPDVPEVKFDYTGNVSQELWDTVRGTRVKVLRYGARVQVVLQNTAIGVIESHPFHLHGFDFYVMSMGFGNYDEDRDIKKFNYHNPQMRNTIAVPVGGWAVIRFIANNPGIWLMHCHIDTHLPWGMAMTFLVENGPSPNVLVPPPPDLPKC